MPFASRFAGDAAAALRELCGMFAVDTALYARFAPATGAGDGRAAWDCWAAAFALRRAISILRICSGVGGFGGSFPAERVARGGVDGRSAMVVCVNGTPRRLIDVSKETARITKRLFGILEGFAKQMLVAICKLGRGRGNAWTLVPER